MALVLRPVIPVTLTFRDDDGKEATTGFNLPGATTAAAALTYAAGLVPLVVACSSASLIGYSIGLSFIENALGVIGSSDIEDKGVITFNTVNGNSASIAIPGFDETKLQGNNIDIDLADTDVADLIDAIVAGLSGTQPANISGSDLIGVKAAYKQNRRSHLAKRRRAG